jgi:formylglycine-generating enzyme required for sulfatase activity
MSLSGPDNVTSRENRFYMMAPRAFSVCMLLALGIANLHAVERSPGLNGRSGARDVTIGDGSPNDSSSVGGPLIERSFRDCRDCPEMVQLSGGKFQMGDLSRTGSSDELPVHAVVVPPFSIGKYDVTFDEWDACVVAGGCKTKPNDERWGRGKHPVMNISWNDTQEYVRWLSRSTGHVYRLPSEAEWDYAARARSTTDLYWGQSQDESQECRYANGADSSVNRVNHHWAVAPCDDGFAFTSPVGSFPPNAFGLYDMVGNVWQWVEDCYQENYVGSPTDGSAREFCTEQTRRRVMRGGAWNIKPGELRSALRGSHDPADPFVSAGFRVARTD